ncbi:MAG: SIMPL domain-containing protein [Cyanobacteria bacterium SZAS LIN-3]|nr:SIMPL domain-containing protein [Cyanobacteria bacterium SZAS LIN-3]
MKKFALIMAISLTLGSAARCEAQSLMSGLLDGLMKRPRTIETSGSATVDVVPDEAILKFGVQTYNTTLATASSENNDRTKDLLSLGKKYGVDGADIQTSSITVQPVYKRERESAKVSGYQVNREITFDVKDLTKMETILSEAVKNGANVIAGMEFKTTELRKYKDQARTEAAKAAHEKAVALAQTLGAEVGKVQTIRENVRPELGYWGGNLQSNSRFLGQAMQSDENSAHDTSAAGAFAAGRIKVQAAVTVTWELE